MCLVQSLDSLRCAQQTDGLDALCAVLLDLGNGINGAAAGCQHGIQNQNITLGDILGQLAEVFHGTTLSAPRTAHTPRQP